MAAASGEAASTPESMAMAKMAAAKDGMAVKEAACTEADTSVPLDGLGNHAEMTDLDADMRARLRTTFSWRKAHGPPLAHIYRSCAGKPGPTGLTTPAFVVTPASPIGGSPLAGDDGPASFGALEEGAVVTAKL
ncbi:hypothetical protein GY45DRAFT_1374069 [Cubamyces sp. BRFM 1775]|nr:hypothetical protein GY45DRAFT_1374069 [Cubamyces sp. BRFM 1775]